LTQAWRPSTKRLALWNLKAFLLIFYRVQLTYATDPNEHFFGFGEQFSHFDMKGKRVPIIVQEQVGGSHMTCFQVTPHMIH
jgi:hypothetical protein